jgi:4-hydroxybenzoate polyprenyltransferase
VVGALVLCCAIFIAGCAGFGLSTRTLGRSCFAVAVLAFLSAYPLLKRFTRLCHYYLGAALALAPVCAWVAIGGTIAAEPIIMAFAVLRWTAGFDIIYACQDYDC